MTLKFFSWTLVLYFTMDVKGKKSRELAGEANIVKKRSANFPSPAGMSLTKLPGRK